MLITKEPVIKVGILESRQKIRGRFNGIFHDGKGYSATDDFVVSLNSKGRMELFGTDGQRTLDTGEIRFMPEQGATFVLTDVTIGVDFHWERKEEQTFRGNLILSAQPEGKITAINEIALEEYLSSVISSEMSETAPLEFLKAHAITSRSWLVRMLQNRNGVNTADERIGSEQSRDGEIVRWYGREDHTHFDVCADDHCQRYQGINRALSGRTKEAVAATSGVFLVFNDEVCDARYYKACGGLSEDYKTAWEDREVPYLTSVADASVFFNKIRSEEDASSWLLSNPDAYCNTNDPDVLRQVLPSFDQETTDFFRWQVVYTRQELEDILNEKAGIDFGTLADIIPLDRGPSGRIFRLKIVGSKKSVIVGKELEIRRWLSRSHLYSSAFVVSIKRDISGSPLEFTLKGGGWGHGVGLCQIGAAIMASKGFTAEGILSHYFRGAQLKKLY